MKVYEILTLVGIIIGPLSAVIVTLWAQGRSATRDRQLQTLRMLLNTRHLPADPAYSVAINMIPLEFNRQKMIMNAWNKYIETVHYVPSEENRDRHNRDMESKQTKLIFEIAKHLGLKIAETDLQMSAYASKGFVERDNLGIQAQVAWLRIANALEGQNLAAGVPNGPSSEQLTPENPTILPAEDKA